MRNNKRRIIFITAGLALSLFPAVSEKISQKEQMKLISTYESKVERGKQKKTILLEESKEYNRNLFDSGMFLIDRNEDDDYLKKLNVTKDGIMGSVEIPKIKVQIPIYHGTGELELQKGAGHFRGSSLPVGGVNTRCILTGHRGLPNAKLFTRLDEMKKGDCIYLNVCSKTLAYQVKKIEVIEPEEIDKLLIEPGKDLLSLITCTPYGINTHRLVITGERIPFQNKEYTKTPQSKGSVREWFFFGIPVVYMCAVIIMLLKNLRRRINEKHKKNF